MNKTGDVEILENLENNSFLIRFLNTGNLKIIKQRNLRNGDAGDEMSATLYGVGILGVGSQPIRVKGKRTKEYISWSNMLKRCYCKKALAVDKSYVDVEVSDDWKNFQKFSAEIPFLDGYHSWCQDTKKYTLDKDILSSRQKIYSKDTCKFMTLRENVQNGATTGLTYLATRLTDGYQEEFVNQAEFARKWGIPDNGGISRGIKHNKNYKGWSYVIVGGQVG